jgi:hypothetical protein
VSWAAAGTQVLGAIGSAWAGDWICVPFMFGLALLFWAWPSMTWAAYREGIDWGANAGVATIAAAMELQRKGVDPFAERDDDE